MFSKSNLLLVAGILLCWGVIYSLRRDFREPNVELMTERQMARSPAFDSYAPNPNFPDAVTFRQPAPGTIARGWEPFDYGPTPVEAARAGKELENPLAIGDAQARQTGALLYATYCQLCHGPKGMGDGKVSERGFPPPLSFLKQQAMDMKDGEMFHILTYGKGNMPAHAVQLSPRERWSVMLHVRFLQEKYPPFPRVPLAAAEIALLYKTNCAACHGNDGSGSILRSKLPNLPDFSSLLWHFSKTPLEITNRIEYGDEPLMPAFRYKLTQDQILTLALYTRDFALKKAGPAPTLAPVPSSAAGMKPEQIFRAYCLACHNADGRGAIVRPGMPDIPDFTSAAWHKTKKDGELSKSILSGGKFMPSMKDKLAPADADKMATFVRAFVDGKQVVLLESAAVPRTEIKVPPEIVPPGKEKVGPILAKEKPLPVPSPASAAVAERLRAAGVLFREYCIVCHGADGSGAPAMRPALPPLPDFTKVSFRDQHSDPQILISILDGKGTLMPANRGRINETQARDLVAYIRAFGPAGAAGSVSLAPNDFQTQFEQLQRQWEALEKEIRALRSTPARKP